LCWLCLSSQLACLVRRQVKMHPPSIVRRPGDDDNAAPTSMHVPPRASLPDGAALQAAASWPHIEMHDASMHRCVSFFSAPGNRGMGERNQL
jgi:hypothetical protein